MGAHLVVINTPEEQVTGDQAPLCRWDGYPAGLFSHTSAQGLSHRCLPKERAEMGVAATVSPCSVLWARHYENL